MIRHTIYGKHFMLVILYDSGNVLMESFFPLRLNECLPVLDSYYYLDMDLCIGICHGWIILYLYMYRSHTSVTAKEEESTISVLPRWGKGGFSAFHGYQPIVPLGHESLFSIPQLPICSFWVMKVRSPFQSFLSVTLREHGRSFTIPLKAFGDMEFRSPFHFYLSIYFCPIFQLGKRIVMSQRDNRLVTV